MNSSAMHCIICESLFTEEQFPRNLQCGRSVCNTCVKQALYRRITCPHCDLSEPVTKLDDLAVNYSLLRVIKSKIYKVQQPSIPPFDHNTLSEEDKKFRCGKHDTPITLYCRPCSEWICSDCLVVDHFMSPSGNCVILGYNKALGYIKGEFVKALGDLKAEYEEIKIGPRFPDLHSFSMKHCSCYKSSHERLKEQAKIQLQNRNNCPLGINVELEKIRILSLKGKIASSPTEIISCFKQLQEFHNYKNKNKDDTIYEEERLCFPLRKTLLEHLRLDLKMLVEGKVPVYAVYKDENKRFWSRITIKENRLAVSCMEQGEPPHGGIAVQFLWTMFLLPVGYRTIFFEIGTEKETFGIIFVKLFESLIWNHLIVRLCAGLEEARYKNSYFYKYDAEAGTVHGGDYEYNNGTGGKQVFGDYSLRPGKRWNLPTKGYFTADMLSTRFEIHLNHKAKTVAHNVGRVVCGLQLLKKVAEDGLTSSVKIKECGFLIPMNMPEIGWLDK